MARSSLLAAILLTAVAIAGCGGSSSKPKPLTRAELTAKANVICRRVISQVDWTKVNPATLPRVVDRLAALEERAASELEKLTPPASMADEWRLIVDGFKLTGPEFKQIAQSALRTANYQLPLSSAQHERGQRANEAGIAECAKY